MIGGRPTVALAGTYHLLHYERHGLRRADGRGKRRGRRKARRQRALPLFSCASLFCLQSGQRHAPHQQGAVRETEQSKLNGLATCAGSAGGARGRTLLHTGCTQCARRVQ